MLLILDFHRNIGHVENVLRRGVPCGRALVQKELIVAITVQPKLACCWQGAGALISAAVS